MAPPVVNSEDPDGTESDRETENEPVSAPSEPPLNIDSSQTESAAPTSQQVIETPNKSVCELTSIDTTKSDLEPQNNSVSDAAPAEFIHPWDGPPAKEPVYPPGTYRGMF